MTHTGPTDREIREYLGHGRGNRKVRIKQSGEVLYYGSTEDTDRSQDYWHYGGQREELAQMVEYDKEAT